MCGCDQTTLIHFHSHRPREARAQYLCAECRKFILPSELYIYEAYAWETKTSPKQFSTFRVCLQCAADWYEVMVRFAGLQGFACGHYGTIEVHIRELRRRGCIVPSEVVERWFPPTWLTEQ